MRRFIAAALLSVSANASAQQGPSVPLWEPITIASTGYPPPTLAGETVPSIRVGPLNVMFDQTPFSVVERRFGLTRGQSGDAGNSRRWVCLSGSDHDGEWILWLQSVAVNGDAIGGFILHRVSTGAAVDARCRKTTEPVSIPRGLGLGMSPTTLNGTLGAPSRTQGSVSEWLFERQSKDRFTTDVSINVEFDRNGVRTIEVLKIAVN